MSENPYFEYLKKERDVDPDEFNPVYRLLRETVRSMKSLRPDDIDYKDFDMLYLMTVHTRKCSVEVKRNKVKDSHLGESEKSRMNTVLDETVKRAYEHNPEGHFGLFGTGIFCFRNKATSKEDLQTFIGLCCDILDMEDESRILDLAEEALKDGIRGVASGSGSQILHLLKPTIFPVMNSWGRSALSNVFDFKFTNNIKEYIPTTRKVLKERDKHFGFRNLIVIDQMDEQSVVTRQPVKTVTRPSTAPAMAIRTREPLCQILYGPPGTGKTYVTAEMAVKICGGEIPNAEDKNRHERIREQYRALVGEGRIKFVTFHQSYGYEEFVEGLRPDIGAEEGVVTFSVKPGVFKSICDMARVEGQSAKGTTDIRLSPGKPKIWKMSLGNTQNPEESYISENCIEDNCVILGWGQGLDFSDCDDRDAIKQRLQSVIPDITHYDFNITEMEIFKNRMRKGDIIMASHGNLKIRAIGRVNGDYEFYKAEEYGQKRSVEWLFLPEEPVPVEKVMDKNFIGMTLYEINPKHVKYNALNRLLSAEKSAEPINYVLIIDEINRGNIAKILGELITLLEDDKRIGGDNPITVTLPYSGDKFSVPSNLYIIGTMNTADRSIALLDTALRRRFCFAEMMPDAELVKTLAGRLEGLDISRILSVMNERIELLYDRDHQLGHSYFLKAESLVELRDIFINKVIPMLQEYFYDDYQKLCYVLGCPYDTESGEQQTANAYPVIEAKRLDTKLPGSAEPEDYDMKLRFQINPDFFKAGEKQLELFFRGILGTLAENAEELSE